MNVYLIRHPKPDIETGTCYGSMDIDIEAGWEQDAEQLASWLLSRLQGSSRSYHSPLKRAALLAEFLIPDSMIVQSLSELDFGDWEGALWRDIPESQISDWTKDITHSAPYNGESLGQLKERVMYWWESIIEGIKKQKGDVPDNVILVTHSGVIKVLVSQLCGWDLAQSHLINPDFLSVTELSVSLSAEQDDFVSLKRLGAGDWV